MGVRSQRTIFRLTLATCILFLLTTVVHGQDGRPIPSNPIADSLLSAGLSQFKAGDFAISMESFDRILGEFESNRATTAAVLLAAKSAYRLGQYEKTRSYLSGFAARYGSSNYLSDASLLDEFAFQALKYNTEPAATIGLMFSLSTEEILQTQEIFNGIRLAVEDYNTSNPRRPVRMVFRDTDGGNVAIRRAFRELNSEGASAIIGTLFSEDARTAAIEAERLKTVFMAPLATDDDLVSNLSFAFQANPSMKVRGAAMARFTVLGLQLDSLAVVVAEDNRDIAERQSDGFVEEASRLGANIEVISVLPNEGMFYQLSNFLPVDTLDHVQAVYIPLASRSPVAIAGTILSNLDRMNPDIRVIGNDGWQDLPQKTHASAYLTTYGNEFWLDSDSDDYKSFQKGFSMLATRDATRLGVTGFDVTNYMLEAIDEAGDGSLAETIRAKRPFQGIGLRIQFDGSNINQALFYHRYKDNILALIR